jgi:hypothetical protein
MYVFLIIDNKHEFYLQHLNFRLMLEMKACVLWEEAMNLCT